MFESEDRSHERFLVDTVNATVQLLGGDGNDPLNRDLLSMEAVEHYFRLYYWQNQQRWDRTSVLDAFRIEKNRELPFLFWFRKVGQTFRLIKDTSKSVIVPWGDEGRELCEGLRHIPPPQPRDLLRRLQRYTVQIHQRIWNGSIGRTVEMVFDRYPVLMSPEIHYDESLGLVLDREEIGAETFMI